LRCLCIDLLCLCCFFFSSRRRHTRSKRDWSSDVCSSDLRTISIILSGKRVSFLWMTWLQHLLLYRRDTLLELERWSEAHVNYWRSEERRVGKECRSRWEPYPGEKKCRRGEGCGRMRRVEA